MTTMMQYTLPGCAVHVPLFDRVVACLGYLVAPGQSLPLSRRTWLQHIPRTLGIVLACLFLLMPGAVRAEGKPALPMGVPNLFDPEVRAQYQPSVVGNLLANPDFPLVMMVNTTGTHPGAVLVALDARNGSDTWSLSTDPIILIALFADPSTITDLYLDSGLLTQGVPSGSFQSVSNPRQTLPDLLHALSEIPARTYL